MDYGLKISLQAEFCGILWTSFWCTTSRPQIGVLKYELMETFQDTIYTTRSFTRWKIIRTRSAKYSYIALILQTYFGIFSWQEVVLCHFDPNNCCEFLASYNVILQRLDALYIILIVIIFKKNWFVSSMKTKSLTFLNIWKSTKSLMVFHEKFFQNSSYYYNFFSSKVKKKQEIYNFSFLFKFFDNNL